VASYCCADHRSLRSFPTRRSSDLQLHLLAGAGGQLVAGEHHRCTGTVGPFAADLGITHAGGEAHTGELDVLDILDFIALEVRSYGHPARVAVMVTHMEETQLGGQGRAVHGTDTVLAAVTWIIGSSIGRIETRSQDHELPPWPGHVGGRQKG